MTLLLFYLLAIARNAASASTITTLQQSNVVREAFTVLGKNRLPFYAFLFPRKYLQHQHGLRCIKRSRPLVPSFCSCGSSKASSIARPCVTKLESRSNGSKPFLRNSTYRNFTAEQPRLERNCPIQLD